MVTAELYDLTMYAFFAFKTWMQIVQKSVGELVHCTVGYMQMIEQVRILEVLQFLIGSIYL